MTDWFLKLFYRWETWINIAQAYTQGKYWSLDSDDMVVGLQSLVLNC